MGLFSAIRNLLGIRKDRLETKKIKRELERMDSRIVKPTDDDLRRIDRKRQSIERVAHSGQDLVGDAHEAPAASQPSRTSLDILMLGFVMIILLMVAVVCLIVFFR